jgi:hypothetical protein
VERLNLTLLYIVSLAILISGCSGGVGLGGDRDASISLLPATKVFTLSKEDPKKLQMVIIADPTGSMVEAQRAMTQYLPAFTQELLSTGFVFEVFCSTTSYTGTTFGEIVSIKSDSMSSPQELLNALNSCINTELTDLQVGDERGLEAAKLTWSKIIENRRLDPNAVKLTMIVTNEDDCSRDLGKYPSDDNVFSRCIDQNVSNSPVEGLVGLGAFPITDNGYADIEGLFPEKIRNLTSGSIELFPTERYINFFKNELNYVVRGRQDSVDELLRQRGHIFAPVIMQPPAAVGRDAAYQCSDLKTTRANNSNPRVSKVMSFGMRYFQVAEGTGNPTYSFCKELEKVLQDINVAVQNEVEIKRFVLNRRPKNPQDLKIEIARQISDVDQAQTVLDRMQVENTRTTAEHQWTMVSESSRRSQQIVVKSQRWTRTLSNGNGFTYSAQNNEIIFDNGLYDSYNDKLKVLSYEPAGLDAQVDYEQQVSGS